jgi:hypothetical protein
MAVDWHRAYLADIFTKINELRLIIREKHLHIDNQGYNCFYPMQTSSGP